MLPTSVARSFSGGVAIRHVLPVLWMTSCLYIKATSRRRNIDSIGSGMDWLPWRILKLTHRGQHRTGGGVCYLPRVDWCYMLFTRSVCFLYPREGVQSVAVRVCVCLSVCPLVYLKNDTSKLHETFRTTCDYVSVFL